MLWRKKDNQDSSINPSIQDMIREIQSAFPGTTYAHDIITRECLINASVNNELLFTISLSYNFPAVPPVVYIQNANGKYLTGLESMSDCGLLDPKNGQLFYHECFGWTPAMKGSTLLYILSVVVRTATKLSKNKANSLDIGIESLQGLRQEVVNMNGGNNE